MFRIAQAADNSMVDNTTIKAVENNDTGILGVDTDALQKSHRNQTHEKMALDYLYRYDCHCFPSIDHLLTAVAISPTRAIVAGTKAYVADGAAGLKIVDVTDPVNPVLVAGETITTAVGTSEAVTVRGDKIYVAAGSAGVAIYDKGNSDSREIIQTGGVPEDFAWVGDYLAVSTVGGVVILETDVTGQTEIVARESSARRGSDAVLRLAVGLGSASDNRLMVANWNYLDVYELKPVAESFQPDIESSSQRIRFSPAGGSYTVTLSNNGQADLVISQTLASNTLFASSFYSGTLAPGDSETFQITYAGSPASGSGKIGFFSNDPDENPLTIQVYGETDYLDPGEKAPDFSLPILLKDPETGNYYTETFTLSEYRGQVVWFGVYVSW